MGVAVVAPRIARVVDPAWFANIDARRIDILSADYAEIIADHRRVLVLWDAHGFEIAELVLGEILPRLADREHLLLMHDISDNRYAAVPRSYGGHPLWKGSKWQQRTGAWDSRVNIGWMNSMQDQVVALADFSARNDVEIGSADHEYAQFFAAHPAHAEEMRQLLGDEFFSRIGHWAFLSSDRQGRAVSFSRPERLAGGGQPLRHRDRRRCRASRRRSRPAPCRGPTPRRSRGGPSAKPPRERPGVDPVPPSRRGRADRRQPADRATKAPFVESQVVSAVGPGRMSCSRCPTWPERGRLVIHTWDAPVSARVRIDDLSLVW